MILLRRKSYTLQQAFFFSSEYYGCASISLIFIKYQYHQLNQHTSVNYRWSTFSFFLWLKHFSFISIEIWLRQRKENKFPAFVKVLKGTYLIWNDYVKQDNQFYNLKRTEEKTHCLSHQSFFFLFLSFTIKQHTFFSFLFIIIPRTENIFTIQFVLLLHHFYLCFPFSL